MEIPSKIAIASDHAGFAMKQRLKDFLQRLSVEYKDFGSFSSDSADYPDFAHPMATAVCQGDFPFGISLCGSGNGINMTANKHQHVRSAICWTPEIARLARLHNNANVCALPARFINTEQMKEIVRIFLSTDFEGGRHLRRINKIPLL